MEGTGASLPPSVVKVEPAHLPSLPCPTLLYAEPCHLSHWTLVKYNYSYFQSLGLGNSAQWGQLPKHARQFYSLSGLGGGVGSLSQALGGPATQAGKQARERAILSDLWFPGKDPNQ